MSTKHVYTAIQSVSKALAGEGISKSRKNDQQNYRFRGIDDVFNALAPLLAEHELVILPRMLTRSVTERPTKTGGVLFYVIVEAEYDFVSSKDGSIHVVRTFGEAMDSGDKATNKAMSAAYKYAAFQAFCIPTEGDHDSENRTHDVAATKPAASSQLENADGPKLTPQQRQRLGNIAKKAGRSTADVQLWLKKAFGVTSSAGLLQSDYAAICAALESKSALPLPGDGEA